MFVMMMMIHSLGSNRFLWFTYKKLSGFEYVLPTNIVFFFLTIHKIIFVLQILN